MKKYSKALSAVFYALGALALAVPLFFGSYGYVSALIQLAALTAASVFIWLGGAASCRGAEKPEKIMRHHVAVIFALYLALLINFTFFDGSFGRTAGEHFSSMSLSEYFEQRGNLVPFRTVSRMTRALFAGNYRTSHYAVNIAGNLAAFAPFALFLPLLFKKCGKPGAFFAATSAAILAVEICQLLLRVGSFDVDDYILNMLGALILFGLLATKTGKKIKARIMDPTNKYSNNRS